MPAEELREVLGIEASPNLHFADDVAIGNPTDEADANVTETA